MKLIKINLDKYNPMNDSFFYLFNKIYENNCVSIEFDLQF